MTRRESLIALYADVFAGRTDYIPLIVSPPCPGPPSREQLWSDPEAAFAKAAAAMAPKLAVDSDWVPSVNHGMYQCVTIPRLYGARIQFLGDGSDPVPEPVFGSADEAAGAPRPAAAGAVVEEVLAVAAAARRGLPEGWALSFPASASPLDLAQLLLGGEEFLVACMTDADAVAAFLDSLTTLFIEVTKLVRDAMREQTGALPEPNRGDTPRLRGTSDAWTGAVTNRGMHFPGLRLPADSIVNMSPDLIRRLALPVIERLASALGPICLHFCTSPAPAAHVLPVLLETGCVLAVDNWQGSEVFWGPGAPAATQSRIAIVGDSDLSTPRLMDEFLAAPAVRDVPRRGGRGIVRATPAASVEEGRAIHAEWRRRFGR
jgi:hypothetical protein